ncbi:MAG: hypothetical protein V4475_06890 [Pseudomonadota bacterium]
MAISPDIESGPYIGNGAQTAFVFGFTAITPAEVAVELDGVAQSAGFSVTLADVGGTVTFATPPASGARIVLRSSPDYLQDSAFENEGAYNLATVNTINRRQTVRALVTRDQAKRAVKAPAGDAADMALPSATARADKLLGFGALGEGARPAVFDISAQALESLAGVDGDIALLADNIGAIDSVAANLSGSNTIGTVATNIADIDTVSGAIGAVGAVAGDLTAINAIAANAANVNAVAGNAANINTVASSAANVSAVAAISANVTQVANDHNALVAVANDLANLDAVANSLPAVNAVVAAAVTLGVFPNTAHVGGNIPKGAISFSFTGGSGGTNSVNNAATFTGGTLTYNPQILYDVVGGAVTNVRMLFGGLFIGSGTPTMPTVVLANGGSGAVTLAGGLYFAAGQGYWATSADGRTLDRIVNTAGAPASNSAAVPSLYLKAVVDELRAAPGSKNLFPDPFFIGTYVGADSSARPQGFGKSLADSPYKLYGAGWLGLTDPIAGAPYPDGKILTRIGGSNLASPVMILALERMGIYPGDVIQIAFEAALVAAGASQTSGQFCSGQWTGAAGGDVGGGGFAAITLSAGSPMNTTWRTYKTASLTVPANATTLRLSWDLWAGFANYGMASFQIVKGAALDKPVQRLAPPDAANRIAQLELGSPTNPANNTNMRRTTYDSAVTKSLVGITLNRGSTFTAQGAFAGNYLAAAFPAGGFNCLSMAWTYAAVEATAPARIFAVVRTSIDGTYGASVPIECANMGKIIAWGWIDVDPLAGNAGNEPIQLFAWDGTGVPSVPKTVLASDLLDIWSVAFIGVTRAGELAAAINISYADMTNSDPDFPGYRIASSLHGLVDAGFGTVGASANLAPTMLLATNPVTKAITPTPMYAAKIAAYLDETPDLAALPPRIWNVVGMETWLYWFGMQHRSPSRTNFQAGYTWAGSYPANPSGQFEEGVCIKETTASTKTLTIQASVGGTLYATKTTSVKTVANTAAAGTTRRLLVLGSSLAQNAGINTEILNLVADTTINPGGAATGMNVVNVGTVGSAPYLNEGRSGQSIGVYFSPGDKFYNATVSDFDITNYINTYLAGVAPTDIIIGDPFWSVASATNDSAAAAGAVSCAALVERMITSINAWNMANPGSLINTIIWYPPHQPERGQDGEVRSLVGSVMQHQRNRNLREVAKLYATQFGTSREANRIFACGFNVVGNAETSVARYTVAPANPGVRARISTTHGPYTDYAAMLAAANVIADNEIVQVGTPNAVSFWVKQGAGSTGGFRAANEGDGFVRRIIDSTHGCPYREMAQQVFACMKNNP